MKNKFYYVKRLFTSSKKKRKIIRNCLTIHIWKCANFKRKICQKLKTILNDRLSGQKLKDQIFFLNPSCLLICTRKTIYEKSKIFLYEVWLFWQKITYLVVKWTGLNYILVKNKHYLYFSIDKQSLTFCSFLVTFCCKYNHFFYLVFPRFETYL